MRLTPAIIASIVLAKAAAGCYVYEYLVPCPAAPQNIFLPENESARIHGPEAVDDIDNRYLAFGKVLKGLVKVSSRTLDTAIKLIVVS